MLHSPDNDFLSSMHNCRFHGWYRHISKRVCPTSILSIEELIRMFSLCNSHIFINSGGAGISNFFWCFIWIKTASLIIWIRFISSAPPPAPLIRTKLLKTILATCSGPKRYIPKSSLTLPFNSAESLKSLNPLYSAVVKIAWTHSIRFGNHLWNSLYIIPLLLFKPLACISLSISLINLLS